MQPRQITPVIVIVIVIVITVDYYLQSVGHHSSPKIPRKDIIYKS